MARPRKTFSVATLRDRVNYLLSNRSDATAHLTQGLTPEQAYRLGVAHLLEGILLDTNNYKGFNLQGSEFLPAEEQTDDKVIRDDADDTRRFYYGSNW